MIKKNVQDNAERYVYQTNENLINIISPSGIDFDNLHTSLGDNVGKIYTISKYPQRPPYGWLSSLCNIEGTSTTLEYHYTEPDRLIKAIDKKISEYKGIYETLKKESERQANEAAVKNLRMMINRIKVQEEPVGYLTALLHIQDCNNENLIKRIKKVSTYVATNQCKIQLLKYKQGQALKVIAPYGIPNPDVTNMGQRNMPLSTFLGGFPMANAGINDKGGYYLGKTDNKRIVNLDMWKRGKDRTNSNWFISGPPGIGKSTVLKKVFTYENAYSTRLIMFDPEEEYVDLFSHPDINGDIIDCAGSKKGRINPLQIRHNAKIDETDLEDGESIEDYFSYDKGLDSSASHSQLSEIEKSSDMALYIQQLRVFFRLYFGKDHFTPGISAILEESLIELYREHGITWNTDISSLKNEDYPILSELYKKIEEKSVNTDISSYKKENYERLLDLLFSAGKGADQLWNGYTTLETTADAVDLIISGLLEADENVKRAQFYNIITWAWHELSKNRAQRVIFGIDEGYLVVDPEYPDLMKFIRNMSKRLRKYEGGLMFITHSCADILEPEVKRYGQAIIDNACYKFIMGCDGKNLQETADLFNLSEKEREILAQKNRGSGILFAGNVRLNVTVDVSNDLLEMFGSAGGR